MSSSPTSEFCIKSAAAWIVAALLLPFVVMAQAPPGVARGIIASIQGDALTLKLGDDSVPPL
jgi:hypothetical protein